MSLDNDELGAKSGTETTSAHRVKRRTICLGITDSGLSALEFFVRDGAAESPDDRAKTARESLEPELDPRIFCSSEAVPRISANPKIDEAPRKDAQPASEPAVIEQFHFECEPHEDPASESDDERPRRTRLRSGALWAAAAIAAVVVGGAMGKATRGHAMQPGVGSSDNLAATGGTGPQTSNQELHTGQRANIAARQATVRPRVSEARLALAESQGAIAPVAEPAVMRLANDARAVRIDPGIARRGARSMDREPERAAVERPVASAPAVIGTPARPALETWAGTPMANPALPVTQAIGAREPQTPRSVTNDARAASAPVGRVTPSAAIGCAQQCGDNAGCMAACAVAPRVAPRVASDAVPVQSSLEHTVAVEVPTSPTRADVVRALDSVAGAVRRCAGDRRDVAFVTIVFAGSGRVTTANTDAPFAGTPEGSCMARAAHGATVAPFARSMFSVRAPFAP